jgi:hypothetical protein
MADVTLDSILLIGSALFYTALGVFVLTVRPRLRQNLLLAGFLLGFGLAYAAFNILALAGAPVGPNLLLEVLLLLASYVFALRLAFEFPEPAVKARRLAAFALVAAAAAAAPTLAFVDRSVFGASSSFAVPAVAGAAAFAGLGVAVQLVLALRAHPSGRLSASAAKQVALVAVALAFLDAAILGLGLVDVARSWAPQGFVYAASAASFALVAGLWLRNARAWGREASRVCRNVAVVIPAVVLVGMAVGALSTPDVTFSTRPAVALSSPLRGIARTAGVLTLTYAILHHQLLGLDVKVRWTIQQSTVGGVLVGAFFLGEQVAQQLLSDQYGFLLGLAAAIAVALAGKRLRAFAERVARAVVPDPGGAPQAPPQPASRAASPADAREDVYLRAVRRALRDRAVTRDEERMLADLAEHLGIGAGRAVQLRHEAEDALDRPLGKEESRR